MSRTSGPRRWQAGALVAAILGIAWAMAPNAEAPPAPMGDAATPSLFAPGVVSTPADEFGAQLSPEDDAVFFNRSVPRSQLYTIFVARLRNGAWPAPEVASFSGLWRDFDPVLSGDGSRLFFISDRPRGSAHRQSYDVWFLERGAAGWSEPQNAGAPVNGEWSNHFASSTRDGTLYFTSSRPGSKGGADVYRSRLIDGKYAEPENLGEAVNGPDWFNIEAVVSPDESFLILSAYGHEDSLGDSDLYVSYRRAGRWLAPVSLGPRVNSAARDYSPRLSPDGRVLMFASERGMPVEPRDKAWTYDEFVERARGIMNGLGNIYQVDLASVLPPAPSAPPAD